MTTLVENGVKIEFVPPPTSWPNYKPLAEFGYDAGERADPLVFPYIGEAPAGTVEPEHIIVLLDDDFKTRIELVATEAYADKKGFLIVEDEGNTAGVFAPKQWACWYYKSQVVA